MSIPLVRNNTKDAINTSIIAIKKNLERINTLLGLVDSSEPDLSGFATKQELEDAVTEINNTIDEVETSLQPVDTVTSGNMRPVTSNAVNSALSVKLPVLLFNQGNKTGNMKYFKANGIFPNVYGEVVYFMQARAGELIVISAGHGDSDAYVTPKAKRLLNTYSKIADLRYSGSVLYFSLQPYSHEVTLTKMSGNWDLTRTSSPAIEVSQSEYNAATEITIET